MIRIATDKDIDLIVDMATKFIETTPYKDIYSVGQLRKVVTHMVSPLTDRNNQIILLSDNGGFLAALATPSLFGDFRQATEMAWWVEPDARGKKAGGELLRAFEFWAKKVGCKLATMSSLDDKVGKYYEKNGYKLYERAYVKEV